MKIHYLLLITLLLCTSCHDNTIKPNVVFILVDDLGWTDLALNSSRFYIESEPTHFHETPHIDELCRSSIEFTNAYASASICSPTRAAIMTGQHPVRLNITDWIPGHDPKDRPLLGTVDKHELGLEEKTIAEHLKDHGYTTFFAGKWHLGEEGYYPDDQGFDYNLGGHIKGSPPGGYYVPYQNPELADGPNGEYLPDRLTDESMTFINNHKEEPFFLCLSYYTVHTPIQASVKHIDHFKEKLKLQSNSEIMQREEGTGETVINHVNADYASMVAALDDNVGRLINFLKEMNLYDNTMIIFTSDNGGLSTLYKNRRPAPTSVMPLRAGKGWLYEGGIRVPTYIKPIQFHSNEPVISHEPIVSHDFYPTILSGLAIDYNHVDGVDLTGILSQTSPIDRDEIFWHFPHYHGSAWKPGSAIRAGDWKLIHFYESDKIELYNLAEDISEVNDLSKLMPAKAEELRQKLEEKLVSMDANKPEINPNYSGG